MNDSILLALLGAVKSAATALVMAIDAFEQTMRRPPETQSASCSHPEDMRRPMGVMTDAGRFFCIACEKLISKE